jgi:putative cardiolipin synthase
MLSSRLLKFISLYFSLLFLSACSLLPSNFEQVESHAYTDTQKTWLGKAASNLQADNVDHSTMYLIGEGTDAFLTRMALLSKAERSVDVQYFIWKSDIIGKLLMQRMLEVADNGVRVRILLDDLTLDSETKSLLFAIDHHKHIEVRIYNPFSASGYKAPAALTDTSRINRRMHNKSFTVDSQYTIVGGRNIEENYFSANVRSNYADLDIVAVGPVVTGVNKQFDLYFNSPLAIPGYIFSQHKNHKNNLDAVRKKLSDYAISVKNSDYAQDIKNSAMYHSIISGLANRDENLFYQGKAHVIYDNPDKTLGKSALETTYMTAMLRPHVAKISNTLELISPYFVPGDEGTEHLLGLVKQGIKVRVITNSLASTDGIMAQSGYARQRYDLLKGGVEIYELKPKAKSKASRSLSRSAEAKSALHAKTYIFDRREVYIGSFNFDPRSAKINTELGVVCEIPAMAQYIASELFDKNTEEAAYQVVLQDDNVVWLDTIKGKVIVHEVQPETSWWRRFNLSIYSILPIESQL